MLPFYYFCACAAPKFLHQNSGAWDFLPVFLLWNLLRVEIIQWFSIQKLTNYIFSLNKSLIPDLILNQCTAIGHSFCGPYCPVASFQIGDAGKARRRRCSMAVSIFSNFVINNDFLTPKYGIIYIQKMIIPSLDFLWCCIFI